jgi:hypothetical protein
MLNHVQCICVLIKITPLKHKHTHTHIHTHTIPHGRRGGGGEGKNYRLMLRKYCLAEDLKDDSEVQFLIKKR